MNTSHTHSSLEQDIEFLNRLLDEVVIEQEGEAFLDQARKIRLLAQEIRKNHQPEKIRQQHEQIQKLKFEEAFKTAKIFMVYFQLVNLCEEMQRIRRIRFYKMEEHSLKEMS